MCFNTFPRRNVFNEYYNKENCEGSNQVFNFLGLPKSVQSDQGTFYFLCFKQVMHELGIKQYRSSAYHPESQGALERFHKTLKNMMRSYCFGTEKDWDEGIHL